MKYSIRNIDERYDFDLTGSSFIGTPRDGTLLFVTSKVKHLIPNLEGHRNCLVFVERGIEVDENVQKVNCVIFSDDPEAEYGRIAKQMKKSEEEELSRRKYTLTPEGYYLGENTVIGEGSVIEPGVLIGHGVIIGAGAHIGYGSTIRNAEIGDHFSCMDHSSIGVDAFFPAKENGCTYLIPSFGKIYIGNHVSIGCNVVIERGFNDNTRICDNAAVDSNVCIGHDVVLHKNVTITCGVDIAGFVEVGEDTYIGMNAAVKQRLSVGANVTVGMGSAVITNVKENTSVFGIPARKFGLSGRR